MLLIYPVVCCMQMDADEAEEDMDSRCQLLLVVAEVTLDGSTPLICTPLCTSLFCQAAAGRLLIAPPTKVPHTADSARQHQHSQQAWTASHLVLSSCTLLNLEGDLSTASRHELLLTWFCPAVIGGVSPRVTAQHAARCRMKAGCCSHKRATPLRGLISSCTTDCCCCVGVDSCAGRCRVTGGPVSSHCDASIVNTFVLTLWTRVELDDRVCIKDMHLAVNECGD